MTPEEKLKLARVFVRGKLTEVEGQISVLEMADHANDHRDELKLILPFMSRDRAEKVKRFMDQTADYWYWRGIKDLAEMVLPKLADAKEGE